MLIVPRGCTTPKVLENIKSAWDEMQGGSGEKDYSLLDGYDALSKEYQLKVRNALEQGHVDNEDWKGVSLTAARIHSNQLTAPGCGDEHPRLRWLPCS